MNCDPREPVWAIYALTVAARFMLLAKDAHDAIDRICERVIGCAIEVHRTMGPGLLESIYRECMLMELQEQDAHVERERTIAVSYKERPLLSRFRIDLLVERCLIVELKAVEAVKPIHKAQVITYLKLTGHPAGLLINFNDVTLKAGLHRLDHPHRYVRREAGGGAPVKQTDHG
jgi:GxxExxY protein